MGANKYREYSRSSIDAGIFPNRAVHDYSGNFPSMTTLANRIQSRIDALSLKPAVVAREAGLKSDYIRDVLRGSKKSISAENAAILAQLLHCNLHWLLTGEGETDNHVSSEDIASSLHNDDKPQNPSANTYYNFVVKLPGGSPEVDARAGAGNGNVGEHQVVTTRHGETYVSHKVISEWVFPAPFLRHELHAAPNNILVLEVVGDSMSPTLESGDRLIIDTNHCTPRPDGVYVIDEGHGPLVKRVQLVRRSDPPEIRIISDNKNHEAYTLRLEDVRVIGRVAGRVSRM